MEKGPSWEANRFSASQEIPHILQNSKVHYCIHVPTTCPVWTFHNKIHLYGEELLAPCPSPKLEDHPA